MLDQAMNKRMRQVFERLLLECLTSFHEKHTPEKLESYAGCMVRWTSVGHMTAHAQDNCALAAGYLTALATGLVRFDHSAHSRLRQLGKCLVLWGRSDADEVEHSEVERDLAEAFTAMQANNLIRTRALPDTEGAEFGSMVSHMLGAFQTWSLQPESGPLQLSDALIALKTLAQHHQDQRIMELSWATANMLDRLIDGTLGLTAEFQDVVDRAAKLLMVAYVFQIWTAEDEAEYATTIEDADILASGGNLSSLST
tara:strand:- start:475 stop:1239 length:765 start_codon:yes stop_codon:yes gene_type:complete